MKYYYDLILYINTHTVIYPCCVMAENEEIAKNHIREYFKSQIMCYRSYNILKKEYNENMNYTIIK